MSLTPSFTGRKVLITGGAQGIGLTIAKKFLNAGATVFILDCDPVSLSKVKETYPEMTTVKADLQDWSQMRKTIEGLGPVHHLVNNAGIGRPAEELLEIKPESVDGIFNINFKAMLNVTQAVARMMIDGKLEKATICNMSSISDTVACPGLAIYSCSKAAVTMLTKCSALELGPYGIRVNCVRPAMVQTEAVGRVSGSSKVLDSVKKINERHVLSGRSIVEMDEVADAVLFLSSSSSSIVTGSEICLDGGIFTH